MITLAPHWPQDLSSGLSILLILNPNFPQDLMSWADCLTDGGQCWFKHQCLLPHQKQFISGRKYWQQDTFILEQLPKTGNHIKTGSWGKKKRKRGFSLINWRNKNFMVKTLFEKKSNYFYNEFMSLLDSIFSRNIRSWWCFPISMHKWIISKWPQRLTWQRGFKHKMRS